MSQEAWSEPTKGKPMSTDNGAEMTTAKRGRPVGSTKKAPKRQYASELAALQNRVDSSLVILCECPGKPPEVVASLLAIAIRMLQGD